MINQGVWVYAVTDQGDGADLSWLAGVGGAGVRGAGAGGLTVLVSDVDLAEFGEEALRANLEDLAWLEEAARAHHSVVEAAASMFPALPTRFATVYNSEARLAAAFAGRAGQLREELRRVGGCVEWGVKAYPGEAGTSGGAGQAGRGAGRTGDASGAGAGMAYLKRRRAEMTEREQSRRTSAASAEAVHAELSEHAAQARLYPPQSPALSGNRTPMLLNAAYLLGRGSSADFAPAVAKVANAHPDLRLDLSGPWPPYSFTAQDG